MRIMNHLKNLIFPEYNSLNKKMDLFISKYLKEMEDQKVLSGKILTNNITKSDKFQIHKCEFKIFSQFGDDGIIQFLVQNIDISNKFFVEFGVENYTESNTRFLLINNNWSGLIMDCSEENINTVKNDEIYWKYDLTAISEFVTKENINHILKIQGVTGEIGLLHIDIDGNDYWIWKAIEIIDPIIVIIEYNSVFGFQNAITVPYKKDFNRTLAHYANLYWGASLLSLCDLAKEKGYVFIGCNSAGNNAYFVRKDRIKINIPILTPTKGYVESKFRESRDRSGRLTFIRGKNRHREIIGLPVYNTRTNKIEKITDI
jgi:hypothetical protein